MFPEEQMRKKAIGYILFSLIGISFVFCFLTGGELQKKGNIVWDSNFIVFILLWTIVGGILLGVALCLLVYTIGPAPEIKHLNRNTGDWKWFVGSALICFIAWIPFFLAYYPGICAYDAVTQIGQIETAEYVEHHPLAHTLLIKYCLFFGKFLFHDANSGVAIYSVLQMFALALTFGYCTLTLLRFGIDKKWLYGIVALFALYPFTGYLSISMTKDIFFTVFFVTGLMALLQMSKPFEESFRIGIMDLLLVVCCVGMMLFRTNGKYALLALIVVLLLLCAFSIQRKTYSRFLLDCVVGFIVGILLLSAISKSVNAVQADRREMLSMPIQQLARCMLYHGGVGVYPEEEDDTMSQEDKDLINELFMGDGYKEYLPFISDPVKNKTLTSVVRYQPKRFFTTYFRLLLKYPGDFINAGLALDAGYLYPGDESHSKVYQVMYPDMEGKGYVQTWWWESVVEKTGITHDSKLPKLQQFLEQFAGENGYLSLPVVKYLFVPGIWLWWGCLCLCVSFVRKEKGMFLASILVMAYFGTLILGPVVQLRYIYPCMIVMPVMTLISQAKGRAQW